MIRHQYLGNEIQHVHLDDLSWGDYSISSGTSFVLGYFFDLCAASIGYRKPLLRRCPPKFN